MLDACLSLLALAFSVQYKYVFSTVKKWLLSCACLGRLISCVSQILCFLFCAG